MLAAHLRCRRFKSTIALYSLHVNDTNAAKLALHNAVSMAVKLHTCYARNAIEYKVKLKRIVLILT